MVEDKVAGISPPTDAFAWGVYKPNFVNLTAKDNDLCPTLPPPSSGYVPDAEQGLSPCIIEDIDNDTGASLTWVATDYDLCPQPDPEGQNEPPPACVTDPNPIAAGIPTTPTTVDCESFPLSSYPLNLIPNGGGNTVVVTLGT